MNIEPFFVVVHVTIGLIAGNAAYIQRRAPHNAVSYPLWIYSSWGSITLSLTVLSAFAAPITTLINYNISYAALTVIEIFIGAFLVGFLSMRIKFIIALIGPAIIAIILGDLWGFWYL